VVDRTPPARYSDLDLDGVHGLRTDESLLRHGETLDRSLDHRLADFSPERVESKKVDLRLAILEWIDWGCLFLLKA
jgi:hypothetical protein